MASTRTRWFSPTLLVIVALQLGGCGSDDGGGGGGAVDTTPWNPSIVFRTDEKPRDDGFLDRRGLIHTHSYFSHDACDNMPVKNGVRDAVCFDDLRRGICQTRHDFIMFTDHPSDFVEAEFPDTLLYRADRGDELIDGDHGPRASWSMCSTGERTLILAGCESNDALPVGLEQHVAATPEERDDIYSSDSVEAAAIMKANGAVLQLAHTEDRSVEELIGRDLNGFEMYNVHANFLIPAALGKAVQLLFRVSAGDTGVAHPDLLLLYVVVEDPEYLSRWGSVLASGAHRTTTMGTDSHRNTLPTLLQDGERGDSFRRLMLWFSNHLLVQPKRDGSWDDRDLKDALRAGRLYGVFELMGYPVGFDFHAAVDDENFPMGADVSLGGTLTLEVTMPSVQNLRTDRTPPVVRARILRAIEGGFEEVASGPGNLSYVPQTPGAYRAEIRMLPLHLREDMGTDDDELLSHDYVWIYSNPIYVTE